MGFDVQLSSNAIRALKRIDRHQAKIIVAWIEKNLQGCENPRLFGKPLRHDKKGEWRYRIGSYRIIAEIQDELVKIEVINVGHRKDIYNA